MTGSGRDAGDRAVRQFAQQSGDEPRDAAADFSQQRWKPPPETALGRVRRLARFIPLVEAWCSPGADRPALTEAERDLLAIVQLSVQRGTSLLIRLPGGLHRLPLLASVMIAADSLDIPGAELADVSGDAPPPGPVALVSARMVRRSELDVLDASSVPVAPALHPHRLRGDGLMSPVRGGRPRLVTGAARLLFAAPLTGFPAVLGIAPRVVVIDVAAETECDWLSLARNWAHAHGSTMITVADLHLTVEPLTSSGGISPGRGDGIRTARPSAATPEGNSENVWIADWPWLRRTAAPLATGSAPSPGGSLQQVLAESRGRAHLLAVEDPSRSGLAEVRERLARLRDPLERDSPWPVRRAARLTRLLTELPTRTADYDRVAPRYGGRTLRRFLDDILDADARNDFPASWRARVAAEWGAVRAGLTAAYEALSDCNPLMEVIADLVEDAYRRCQELDIVCGSRSARDALAGRLASSGTLRIEDSPLVTIRSINTADAAWAHRATLLIGPPAARWRHRLTAADLGQLIVVGASADLRQLSHALRNAYGEPSREDALGTRCAALTALTSTAADEDELDGAELRIGVTTQKADRGPASRIILPDPGALITAALAEPPDGPDSDLADFEAEPDGMKESPEPGTRASDRSVRAVPVLVRSTALEETGAPAAVLLATATRVQRLRGDEVRLLPVKDVAAGMILIGISEPERRTLFDRIRPLLAEQRPQAAELLLQLWRVALDDARAASGSVTELTGCLSALGADISTRAVARWSDPARIGPMAPANVARIGKIAGSGVVAGEARRIAAVMREVRARHTKMGSALVRLAGWHASGDYAALDHAAECLGTEITDLAADLTAWRVIAVGDPVLAPISALRRPMSAEDAQRISRPAPGASAPDEAGIIEARFLSIQPASDQEEP